MTWLPHYFNTRIQPHLTALSVLKVSNFDPLRDSLTIYMVRSFATVTDLVVLEDKRTVSHTPTNRRGRVKPIVIYGCCVALFTNALVWRGPKTPLCHCIASRTVSQGCHRPPTMTTFTKKDNYVKSHMYTRLQLYAGVEEFELKLWPKLRLDD
jgi:hypothetical protein